MTTLRNLREDITSPDGAVWVGTQAWSWFVTVTAVVALVSAMVGRFSAGLALFCGVLTSGGAVWTGRRHLKVGAGTVSSVVALVFVVAVTGWNIGHHGEQTFGGRDGGTYVNTARSIADHGSISIPVVEMGERAEEGLRQGTLGFYETPGSGVLQPQFLHLLPAFMAVGFVVGGDVGLLSANALVGAGALLSFFFLGRCFLRPGQALVATVALAFSSAFYYFARNSFSEIFALMFFANAVGWWWRAHRGGSPATAAVAGVWAGLMALARLDGLLMLIPLVAVAGWNWRHDSRMTRWMVRGAAGPVLLSLIDLFFFSQPYLGAHRGQVLAILGAVGVAGVVASLWPDRDNAVAARVVAWGLGLGFVGLAVRPWFMQSRGVVALPQVELAQAADGLPIDPTRTYAESTVSWLSWYLGWPAVIIGVVGLLMWTWKSMRNRDSEYALVAAAGLVYTLVYLVRPSIAPDQIWAIRRFSQVIIPVLILSAAWLVAELVERLKGGNVAAVLAAATIMIPVVDVPNLDLVEQNGALVAIHELCEMVGTGPVLVVDQTASGIADFVVPPLRSFCGVDVASTTSTPPVSNHWSAFVTDDPTMGDRFEVRVQELEPSVSRRPVRVRTVGIDVGVITAGVGR